LWFGTDGGLSRLKNGRFVNITNKEGLFDDALHAILEDDRGNFWMSCNRGIFRVSQKELNDFCDGKIKTVHSISYNEKDGMKSRECNGGSQPAGCKTRDGKLWFPTIKGVVMIDPNNIKTNTLPPPVIIEQIVGEDRTIEPPFSPKGQKPVFPPGKNKLSIKYTGLSFPVPERVLFKTKLEGYDTRWQEAGTRRAVYYTSLSPGDYTFHVTACNNDGVWNETGAAVSFYLKPWFHQTGWFYFFCVLVMVSMVFAVSRFFLLKIRAAELH
ncbi:MAG: histidine kinase, partial [bacterium]|nr:histidine kinase [bacterium]